MSPLRRRSRKQEPSAVVTIQGESARAALPEGPEAELSVGELFAALDPGVPDTRDLVLPDGTQAIVPVRSGFLLVHQTPPAVHGFRWIAPESETDYGPGTTYHEVRLALPYLIVVAIFQRVPRGKRLQLGNRNECFFSNQPLLREGMETPLYFPALLNCSRFPDTGEHPLSWICTQHLSRSEYARRPDLGRAVHDGLNALIRHLLETGFNRSSEQHEVSSWFTETVNAEIDPRLASVEAWEAASREDPLFALEVPWLPTGMTLGQVIDHIRRRSGGDPRTVECAGDLARVVMKHSARSNEQPALPFTGEDHV